MFQQIVALFRLIQEEEVGETIEKRLVYLTKNPLPGALRSGRVTHALHEYESVLDSISLLLHDGNGQQAQYGHPLQQPLVVEVMADLPQGKVPMAGFPVRFAFEAGAGEIDPSQPTNAQGLAKATVTRVEPAQSSVTIMASGTGKCLLPVKSIRLNSAANSLRDFHSALFRTLFQQYAELIAAKTRQRVGGPNI